LRGSRGTSPAASIAPAKHWDSITQLGVSQAVREGLGLTIFFDASFSVTAHDSTIQQFFMDDAQ